MNTHGLLALFVVAIASAHAGTPGAEFALPVQSGIHKPFAQKLLNGPRYYRHSVPYLRIQTAYGPIYIQEDRFFSIIDLSPSDEPPRAESSAPAIGSVLSGLPNGFSTFLHDSKTLFHADGTFFAYHGNSGFIVIEPPDGALVRELPIHARRIETDGSPAFMYRDVLYTPVEQFGKTVYRIGRSP